MTSKLYYDPARPSAFSTAKNFRRRLGRTKKSVRTWLEKQDAYTLHRQVRKRFPRNPYSVTNVMDVWKCDLLDVQSLGKFKDGHKYILTVIDVFSKYLHMVPLKVKTGGATASAFESALRDHKYRRRRPIWVRTDKGKEFLAHEFQAVLKREGIQFQVCKNPDVKCSVVERAHRTVKSKIYKYFTYKNTYRYIDVLPKFVKAYNATVHSATGMAPAKVTYSDVLAVWQRMNDKRSRIRTVRPKFRVGQYVRISKEKMKFAKGYEQNFSTEIFRIAKVIERSPRPVYELEYLNKTPIDGQFYQEELTPVSVTSRTQYKINKILKKRVRRGITEYLDR